MAGENRIKAISSSKFKLKLKLKISLATVDILIMNEMKRLLITSDHTNVSRLVASK